MESTIDDLQLTESIENDCIILQYSKNDTHSNISKGVMNYDDNLQILSRIAQAKLKEGDTATTLGIVSEMREFHSFTMNNNKEEIAARCELALRDISEKMREFQSLVISDNGEEMIVQCEQAIIDIDKIIKTNADKQLN